MNNNSSEINFILNNIKKYYLVFILFNILILIGFTFFYLKTYEIKNEKVNIKFITTEFPFVTDIKSNIDNYISFKTDYDYDTDSSTILSNWPYKIDIDELNNEMNIFFDQYGMRLYSLIEKVDNLNENQELIKTINSINHYFQLVDFYKSPFMISEKEYIHKYNSLNYLTIIFSLIIFMNFFLYILILIKNNLIK
ncbi:hypothetical protein N9E32_03485 [Alphaproteobacteria bacterium]|nr:hypothetical protein [Alphaproteobacteria bacterium]